MDSESFRVCGKTVVDYIADYMDNIRDRPVLSTVKPGYLYELVPPEAPVKGEDWKTVLADVENIIMPGITHWNSPQFHAFFPTGNSYPAIVGDMLCNGIGSIGFSWITSPACTELEVQVMNWFGKILDLPKEFLNESEGPGGGVLQGSASEATFVCLLAAKDRTTKRIKALNPSLTDGEIKAKLVAYTSDQSNSSVEKAGLLGSMPMRMLKADESGRMTGPILAEAMAEDVARGLIPCYVVATLGTTGTCAFDCLEELGPICNENDIWLHVDAAYAGAAFVLPEYRHLMAGVQFADSFDVNLHKWLLVNFDCSALWVKNATYLVDAFNVDRVYLKHSYQSQDPQVPDYRHWQIPLGRRFRSLKMWFVLRLYGVEGLQAHIKKQVHLADLFGKLVNQDPRFEVITVTMGLVCFRLKGNNDWTKNLYERLMASGQIYLVTATVRSELVIRFVVCSRLTEEVDVQFAWDEIRGQADRVDSERDVAPASICNGLSGAWPKDKVDCEELTAATPIVVKSLTQG
ncbi:aromatic-L-amino-acid decarboxylase-like [Metopolophium dirhodum]|uniref:aromatic-L-amino-acid decarboxylase-like n=1 Tax=Metopolophium dirhodum TaxID=44670 RepID=UPI00298F6E8B|nr:aromatic-L-amino-acid decarboxylase-like [Metopolophium dirhodum]XP_060863363.1 aromatic-L-amino-acid decarboxylase-like [Metopolophium dirhodum]XP_060863364.1 aromatic-L-amino-acid decarboxylase-like [Metopolophium dirhodum]